MLVLYGGSITFQMLQLICFSKETLGCILKFKNNYSLKETAAHNIKVLFMDKNYIQECS